MDICQAYDTWAEQYDLNTNKTRDLEAKALKTDLAHVRANHCLEIGCGTGKNTQWLVGIAKHILAVDFSDKMLAIARSKIKLKEVQFVKADILSDWKFAKREYDLITFSLVLEHIEKLDFVFNELRKVTAKGGLVYIGELHPFKQYSGSKARFDIEEKPQVVTCFNHHISDFIHEAKQHGFEIMDLDEHFDDNDKSAIPRILTLLFRKL